MATEKEKRKVAIDRSAVEWSYIQIVAYSDTPTPVGRCVFCGISASWTSARIKDHFFGMNGFKVCKGESDTFLLAKEYLADKRLHIASKKQKKFAEEKTNLVASGAPPTSHIQGQMMQVSIGSSTEKKQASAVGEAIARFIYAESLSPRLVQ